MVSNIISRLFLSNYTMLAFLKHKSVIFNTTLSLGDITPDTWPSKLFMAIMILVALVVVPTQVTIRANCLELLFFRFNLVLFYLTFSNIA
jgi:hypothetical protein